MSFAFESIVHDRNALMRGKNWRDLDGKTLCVGADWVGTDGSRLRFVSADQTIGAELAYLGQYEGQHYFAAIYDRVPDQFEPRNVRLIGHQLSELEASLLVHAIGLAQWHRHHHHCAMCGAKTVITEAGHSRHCENCGSNHFPRTDPAVIVLITDDSDRALLGRQPAWPEDRYSTLAGFVEPGESLEAAVRREMFEEVGLTLKDMRYAASQPWPFPASLMLGFYATAYSTGITIDHEEIADARWFTRQELSELTNSGQIKIPGPISISRWLIDNWHGGELGSSW